MPDPLFSIIVPTYNSADKLAHTLDSILAQSAPLFECLVVDGASTDNTSDIARNFGDKIQVVSQTDNGVYDAMNRGIARSKGRFLYFIGAGDSLRPGVLEQIAEHAQTSGPTLLYGDVFAATSQQRIVGEVTPARLRRKINICHQAIFTSRDVFELVGKFDLKYKTRADNVINIKAFGDDRIGKLWMDIVVADYEGGGLSDRFEDDEFNHDFPSLIRTYFGAAHYALYRAEESRRNFLRKLGRLPTDAKRSSAELPTVNT